MATSTRILTLRDRHAGLDQAIQKESSRPMPDNYKISELKREKLRIKDAITELQR